MALNPSIILAGTQPDLVNSFARGQEAGARSGEIRNQNALRGLLKEQGPNILAGDQNALNALSRFDPTAALGVQDSRLQIKQREQDLVQAKETARLRAMTVAANLSAQQRAQEAETLNRALGAATQAQTPEQWDAIMQQFGATDLAGQFENRDVIIAGALGLKEALEMSKGDAPMSPEGKLMADLRAGRITEEQFNAANQKSGMRVSSDGQGGFTIEQGVGVTGGQGKPPTERQSTLNLFGGLMDETMPEINRMEDDPNFDPASIRTAAAGGGTVANFATTPQARRYEALKRQWAEGVLRIQTGAAATQDEIERVLGTYFPRPGDDAATVAQKRQQRDAFARSLVPASGGTMVAPGGAGERGAIGGQQPGVPDFTGLGVADLTRIDVTQLDEAGLDAFIAAMEAARGQ